MMWAVYVYDPIGYMHLICECKKFKDVEQCVYQWSQLSTFWKQWSLDYPEHNLSWSIYKTNERNMPEIMHELDTGIHRLQPISRRNWEETYDHKWSHY